MKSRECVYKNWHEIAYQQIYIHEKEVKRLRKGILDSLSKGKDDQYYYRLGLLDGHIMAIAAIKETLMQ